MVSTVVLMCFNMFNIYILTSPQTYNRNKLYSISDS